MIKVGRKETMTVADLREALNRYPQDMPVFATWESVWASFKTENFRVERYKGDIGDECVVIDVEDYHS